MLCIRHVDTLNVMLLENMENTSEPISGNDGVFPTRLSMYHMSLSFGSYRLAILDRGGHYLIVVQSYLRIMSGLQDILNYQRPPPAPSSNKAEYFANLHLGPGRLHYMRYKDCCRQLIMGHMITHRNIGHISFNSHGERYTNSC